MASFKSIPLLWVLALAAIPAGVRAQSAAGVTSGGASGTASMSALSMPRQAGQPAVPTSGGPRVFAPTMPRTAYTRYPWKLDIVATVFWIGEQPTQGNPTPNHKSSWDTQWMTRYGGFDDPDPAKRTPDFLPVKFTPGLNPFYIALPYNDCVGYSKHKEDAEKIIPWFRLSFRKPGTSVLRGTWLAIRYGNSVCYAQWEDCGPFVTDDADYVFGNSRPKNTSNGGAGIDLSPAVRDYLGLKSGQKVDWRFVDINEIPDGPWCRYGMNNHFVRRKDLMQNRPPAMTAARLDELRRLRDEYFRKPGQ